MRYLTVALTEGQLASKTTELFKKVDITCKKMKDKSSREPIFVSEGLGIRFSLARTNDMPTYAEYRAADIDISSKDTVLEEGRKLYEVLDLGFGKYRMCICGSESARELLQHHEMIRMAMKYPGIARDYPYNKKHQTMGAIRLNGSIELAPIMGLSEVIVDVVETGSTLRGNGLTVLEEVRDLSVKVIVNQVNTKRENERTMELIHDLQEVLTGKDVGG